MDYRFPWTRFEKKDLQISARCQGPSSLGRIFGDPVDEVSGAQEKLRKALYGRIVRADPAGLVVDHLDEVEDLLTVFSLA